MSDNSKSKSKSVVKEQQGYYDIPERYEIINGVRYDFLSSPKLIHQKLLGNIFFHLRSSCHLNGEIILAPMDVHFDEDNIAQPDMIFISTENKHIMRDGFIYGAPDLLMEILSQSTGRKDKTVKKEMYEQFGVKEYWIVEPNYCTVDQFVLVDGKYLLHDTLTEENIITSPVFPCMSIDLKSIFTSMESELT